ncbi:hypothetical protein HDU76_012615 [Blyttiomyces sp. JEL0837]|nr:hypothetical protein HDU76_012615 [Blyttiomyces sp. JEL0837]
MERGQSKPRRESVDKYFPQRAGSKDSGLPHANTTVESLTGHLRARFADFQEEENEEEDDEKDQSDNDENGSTNSIKVNISKPDGTILSLSDNNLERPNSMDSQTRTQFQNPFASPSTMQPPHVQDMGWASTSSIATGSASNSQLHGNVGTPAILKSSLRNLGLSAPKENTMQIAKLSFAEVPTENHRGSNDDNHESKSDKDDDEDDNEDEDSDDEDGYEEYHITNPTRRASYQYEARSLIRQPFNERRASQGPNVLSGKKMILNDDEEGQQNDESDQNKNDENKDATNSPKSDGMARSISIASSSSIGSSKWPHARELSETIGRKTYQIVGIVLALILNACVLGLGYALSGDLKVNLAPDFVQHAGGVAIELILLASNFATIYAMDLAASIFIGGLLAAKYGYSMAACGFIQTAPILRVSFTNQLSLNSLCRKNLERFSYLWIIAECIKVMTVIAATGVLFGLVRDIAAPVNCIVFDPSKLVDRTYPTVVSSAGVA